ncbi:MAG: hypothetical protein HY286_09965 [Planctomycetes bacterium]|nr:hypothetical protein [Planctomycetota bacterium]
MRPIHRTGIVVFAAAAGVTAFVAFAKQDPRVESKPATVPAAAESSPASPERAAFGQYYTFAETNCKNAEKIFEVRAALEKARRLLSFATNAQKEGFGALLDANGAMAVAEIDRIDLLIRENSDSAPAELKKFYQSVVRIENDINNKVDVPILAAVYQLAEEALTVHSSDYKNTKSAATEAWKECFELAQNHVNQSADFWAYSERYGFKTVEPRNLLIASEFTKKNEQDSNWSHSNLSEWTIDGSKLIAYGIPRGGDNPVLEMRAGVIFWGPNGSKVQMIANGKDILPGTRQTMRHYELTLKFKVIKKGFTLLARHTGGYRRHAYGFETLEAQDETKSANGKAKRALNKKTASAPAASVPARFLNDERSTNFPVVEGKTYEVIEQVYGNKVMISAREAGEADYNLIEDNVRARYGGVGIQLLPGSEVQFETVSIRILM